MIHPLVRYDKRTLRLCQMGNGIFCQNGNVIGGDQLRNTVVDLRVDMVGTTREYNAALVVFF